MVTVIRYGVECDHCRTLFHDDWGSAFIDIDEARAYAAADGWDVMDGDLCTQCQSGGET